MSRILLCVVAIFAMVSAVLGQISCMYDNQCASQSGVVWANFTPNCGVLYNTLNAVEGSISCGPQAAGSNLLVPVISGGIAFDLILYSKDKCNANWSTWECSCNRTTKKVAMPLDIEKYGASVLAKDTASLKTLLDDACAAFLAIA
eukprot:ANDGO_07742.mRNA.1 hypothetical protein